MINDFEIRVIAMQRSGHHAVINWIRGLFKKRHKICFLNDFSRFKNPHGQSNYYNFSEEEELLDISGEFVKKRALIMNFEDIYFNKLDEALGLNEGIYPRGESRRVFNILVLRDPYNMFASRLRHYNNIPKDKRRGDSERWIGDNSVNKWCEHADVFLKNRGERGLVCINYNKWFSNKVYRENLSKRLGLRFSDRNISLISRHGGGSSFESRSDSIKRLKDGGSLGVLERWRTYSGNKKYEGIFSDRVSRLSLKIFGNIRVGDEHGLEQR